MHLDNGLFGCSKALGKHRANIGDTKAPLASHALATFKARMKHTMNEKLLRWGMGESVQNVTPASRIDSSRALGLTLSLSICLDFCFVVVV